MMTNNEIKAKEAQGFKRWTKGDYDRLYINVWQVPGVETRWQKNGKKLIAINGTELSYTKTAAVSYAKIYIDVKSGDVVVDTKDGAIKAQLEELVKAM